MDTGGVRGLVQRFEEIKEVQASQSTRDAGLCGLKRRKLKMESDIEKDTYSNPGKLVRHIVSGRRGSPSRRQAGGSPSSPRRARAVGGSVWTRPAGSGKVQAGQGGLRVPPVGGAGQHNRPTINYARWATTTLSYSSCTGSGHKLCDWKVGQGGGTPIGGRACYTGAVGKTWSPAKQGD